MLRVSIVVPVLNEEAELPGLFANLAPFAESGAEVIVVDGGSTDLSVAISERTGCVVIRSARGRAAQMNAGAAQARGDVFLFLHADTRLPAGATELATAVLADGRFEWGRFDVRIAGERPLLRVVAAMMNGRSRLTGIATGDQAIFVTRQAFDKVGGFPDQPLMEDIELSKRLLRLSPPACLEERVTTSARRWETRGVFRTILLMWRLRFDYWRGVPASVLADSYR
jgi:rSAM/selenodomain-associated transferase 2